MRSSRGADKVENLKMIEQNESQNGKGTEGRMGYRRRRKQKVKRVSLRLESAVQSEHDSIQIE